METLETNLEEPSSDSSLSDDDIEIDDFIEEEDQTLQPLDTTTLQTLRFEGVEYEVLAERKRKALKERQPSESATTTTTTTGSKFEEMMEEMLPRRKKTRRNNNPKKKGRRKGSKNKLSPIISKKLGEANLYFAKRSYKDAIRVLEEVIKDAPNLSEAYLTLGLIYEEIGDKKKAVNIYMLALCSSTPKDDNSSLWKRLFVFSMEEGNVPQAGECLYRAVRADPKDLDLRFDLASFYNDHGNCFKSAKTYHRIVGVSPENASARIMAAKKYKECNKVEISVKILKDYIGSDTFEKTQSDYLGVVDELVGIHMENGEYVRAFRQIEQAHSVYERFDVCLAVKEVICHVHVGNVEKAEVIFKELVRENRADVLIMKRVADSYMNFEHYQIALKYYLLSLVGNENNGFVHHQIGRCYLSLKERAQAVESLYTAVRVMPDNIDARLTLASVLLEEKKENEAIALLSPPEDASSISETQANPWWDSGKIKLQLANIYHDTEMLEEFVGTILSSVQETLFLESLMQKVKKRKRLSTRVLSERVKVLDGHQANDFVFRSFRPIAPQSEMLKATRAKKQLEKKAALKDKEKAAVLAAGQDWHSDHSDDEPQGQAVKEPPLPKLLNDDEHYQLILKICKALDCLKRYLEALEIIDNTLGLPCSTLTIEKREELLSLKAQISLKAAYQVHAYDCAQRFVEQNPHSFGAWNCYYGVTSRLESRPSKHSKFLRKMRHRHTNFLPPMIIYGHQLTLINEHQSAAREYLKAYKLQPDNPLINLCVGTALINLSLGLRIQNRNRCFSQGFAFLYNNLRLCKNSQEAVYNIARAYHHVGLVTLAASYYEKVLATPEKDYLIPMFLNEDSSDPEILKPVTCNLRREAAHNLHLIYKESGALDLARQVLRDHCTL
ncbi:hypothetical protein GIB67_025590 [Kingdonia uniflora]|uniref:General transcription factor 3C polypeptide 3 n=1 Tax=Kingdonia uniflora TaxID=39325 RepID=A0A7J7M0G6_9MAGN|nr:hypothetical protein GIB67_025590 [Kingdonia uniflora]